MFEYKYLGKEQLQLVGYGIVYPKDVIKVKTPINHPLFVLVDPKKKTYKNI